MSIMRNVSARSSVCIVCIRQYHRPSYLVAAPLQSIVMNVSVCLCVCLRVCVFVCSFFTITQARLKTWQNIVIEDKTTHRRVGILQADQTITSDVWTCNTRMMRPLLRACATPAALSVQCTYIIALQITVANILS